MSSGDLERFNSIVLVLINLATLHILKIAWLLCRFYSFISIWFFTGCDQCQVSFCGENGLCSSKHAYHVKVLLRDVKKCVHPSACMKWSLSFQTLGYIQESFSSSYFILKPWRLWRAWDLKLKIETAILPFFRMFWLRNTVCTTKLYLAGE